MPRKPAAAPPACLPRPSPCRAWPPCLKNTDALDRLQGFVSGHACALYGLTPPAKTVRLERREMLVPDAYEGYGQKVVPMEAGCVIPWSLMQSGFTKMT